MQALLQRADAAVVAAMEEVVRDTTTEQDMHHERNQLTLLNQELQGASYTALTPAKRASLSKEILTRQSAIATVLNLVQVKLKQLTNTVAATPQVTNVSTGEDHHRLQSRGGRRRCRRRRHWFPLPWRLVRYR